MYREDIVPFTFAMVLCLTIVAAFTLLFNQIEKERVEWEAFKEQHACKVVAKVGGEVFTTFVVGTNGTPVIGMGSTPDKTGWLCDDGIIYYR